MKKWLSIRIRETTVLMFMSTKKKWCIHHTENCRVGGGRKEKTRHLKKWTHPPSLWRRNLKWKSHTNIKFSLRLTEHPMFQILVCVCYSCALCNIKNNMVQDVKNIRVKSSSCRLRVSLLKQKKHPAEKPLLVQILSLSFQGFYATEFYLLHLIVILALLRD